ncbi:MAG TPA: hypothetical protein DCY07_02525 [Rhodospirillaceae bacterium]|nr:hypothetical protein [Rhodospirillaceae bacterium]
MASRTIEVILKAKNAMAAGLSSAGSALKKFGQGAWDIGKKAAIGIAAASAAIGAFAYKALQAYAESEAAINELTSALRLNGDEVDDNVRKHVALAAAIQDETGASDDSTVSNMARLRMLGITTEKLGDAAKAVIALRSAGMDEEAAVKAIAAAYAGEYTQLQKRIPALKSANSETEKAAILNDFLTKGYAQQKDKLKTVAGAWGLLKERIGDVMENLGGAIAKNELLHGWLIRAGDAVKRFGENVAQFLDSEKFKAIQNSVQQIVEAMLEGGSAREEAMKIIGNVLKASFAVAVENAVDLLKKAAPAIGRLIGAAAKALMGATKEGTLSNKGYMDAAGQLGIKANPYRDGWRGMGALKTVTDEQDLAIRRQMVLNREQQTFAELGVEAATALAGQTAAQIELNAALAEAAAWAEKRAAATPPAATPPAEEPESVNLGVSPGELIEKDLIETNKKINELLDKRKTIIEEGKAAFLDAEREKKKAALDVVATVLKAEREAVAKVAAMRVAEFIANQNKVKEEKDADLKDAAKAARLRKKQGKRGLTMGKKDQEWLDAFDNIGKAKGKLGKLDLQIKAAEDAVTGLKTIDTTLQDLRKDYAANTTALKKLYTFGGP